MKIKDLVEFIIALVLVVAACGGLLYFLLKVLLTLGKQQ